MKFVATRKSEQNEAAIDPWTVVHFASGLAAGLIDMEASKAYSLAIVYEIGEQFFERDPEGQQFFRVSRPESLANSVVDVLVFIAGHKLGRAWNRT